MYIDSCKKIVCFSDGDDDYEEDFSEYSDDSVKRPQPTRRSVRNRKTVVDPDFSKQTKLVIILKEYE